MMFFAVHLPIDNNCPAKILLMALNRNVSPIDLGVEYSAQKAIYKKLKQRNFFFVNYWCNYEYLLWIFFLIQNREWTCIVISQ